jgi:hypothetical protein
MRSGTIWGGAVLASLALLVSGQLCMVTTCVPRLQRPTAHAASTCCHAAPSGEANAPAPMPSTAMPCGQALQLASAPMLDAPLPAATTHATAHEIAVEPEVLEAIEVAPVERDTGPGPGVHSPAPTGLRAPPRA